MGEGGGRICNFGHFGLRTGNTQSAVLYVYHPGPMRSLRVVQGALGEIVYVDLPEVGAAVTKGKEFAVVESVKVCGRSWYS